MTINIAVVTSEALVLGCDSVASTTRHLLDPFSIPNQEIEPGRFGLEFGYNNLIPHVSDAWGGVTKMFPLIESANTNGLCVAAITAGLARFNDRTMSSFAFEFAQRQKSRKSPRVTVEAIAKDFVSFLRKEFKRHYENSSVPERLWDGPVFLIGGYSRDDQLPSLYRVDIKNDTVELEYGSGNYGVAWAGQSDAVQRLMFGIDYPLQTLIEKQVKQAIDEVYESTSQAVESIIQQTIDKLGMKLPDDIDLRLPEKKDISLSWKSYTLSIPFQSLPIQDAIDFASFLVNLQSARAKFVPGIATVGGRTHIAVLTKADGFSMLSEPELHHRNIGFSNDH